MTLNEVYLKWKGYVDEHDYFPKQCSIDLWEVVKNVVESDSILVTTKPYRDTVDTDKVLGASNVRVKNFMKIRKTILLLGISALGFMGFIFVCRHAGEGLITVYWISGLMFFVVGMTLIWEDK